MPAKNQVESPVIPAQWTSPDRFIALQAILDRDEHVYGYEFLFRNSADAHSADADQHSASTSTIDLSLLLGAQSLTGGDRAFVNCTRDVIVSGIATLLPKDQVVIELLEQIAPDDKVLDAVLQLKADGYMIAVDDVVTCTDRLPLIELSDIVKVDILQCSREDQEKITRLARAQGSMPLAEKVETRAQYNDARAMGYTLFQGYYFCRPSTISTRELPCMHLNQLRLLRTVMQPKFDLFKVEEAIRREPAFCYRLLRYLNSAAFGLLSVSSIRYALALLGEDEIRKWVSVVAAVGIAGRREAEVIRLALIRARFCELMEPFANAPGSDLFLVGLLSLLGAMLGRSTSFIIEQIPIPPDCKEALTGTKNSLNHALALAIAGERGDWAAMPQLCAELRCSEAQVFERLVRAQAWVFDLLRSEV